MRPTRVYFFGVATALFLAGTPLLFAGTFNVSDNTTLASALTAAQPGDTIVLADGAYAGFTMSRSGTAENPIIIRAATTGGATISSGIVHLNQTSHVTVQGLKLTTAGNTQTVDGESFPVAVWLDATTHCRISRCDFKLSGHARNTVWLMIGGASDGNRIDTCDFGPNTVDGCHYIWPRGNRTIPGVTPPADRTAWAEGRGAVNPAVARNTRIDHNYIHDMASGTAEAIVTGGLGTTGDYQDVNTLIESNLFENCDGDPEFVSVKSSSNIIRYNTVRTCAGMISLRAGNNSVVHGNFFFQANKSGAGGIKLYEKNHLVYNNYIDGASEYPILLGAGDSYTASNFAHAQVFNARVVHNTVVNAANRPVIMGHGSNDLLPPTDVMFANNLLQGTVTLFSNRVPVAGNSVYAANLAFSSGSGLPATGFQVVNPQLASAGNLMKLTATSLAVDSANATYSVSVTDDMDGQPRNSPDIGADEFSTSPALRRPLTATDVGPGAPDENLSPTITTQPASQLVANGATVVFSVATTGSGLSYQWKFQGGDLPGATQPSLVLSDVGPDHSGIYNVVVTNSAGSVTSTDATLSTRSTSDPGRIINLSIRSIAGSDAQTLIVGAALGGAGTSGGKPLLLRAAGPALAAFGVSGALADPMLTLFSGTTALAMNDDWDGNPQVTTMGTQVGAFAFAPETSKDAALVQPALALGSYTIQLTGAGGSTGVALAEIYDATPAAAFTSSTPRLINVSARTQVGTGGDLLICGFVVGGSTHRTVLIRAVGPTLSTFGVTGTLADPKLELFNGSTRLFANDNWDGAAFLASAAASVGAFELNPTSKDSALLVTLPPGSYTAQISGVGVTTGVALVEVYAVGP